jgi:hypothetical protein
MSCVSLTVSEKLLIGLAVGLTLLGLGRGGGGAVADLDEVWDLGVGEELNHNLN